MSHRFFLLATAAVLCTACSAGDDAAMTDTGMAATPATAASNDPNMATGGGGVPAGYMARVDDVREGRPPNNINDVSYTSTDGRWEVKTGPAHIIYAMGDTASGSYTVSATVDQLEDPAHPEAFGLFIGGSNLDQPSQQYTYFIVRHTGEYLLTVREGATTRAVKAWTASPNVPKSDAGKASYKLTAHVDGDSTHFMVNDQIVTSVATASIPTNGIAGLRINHNLHVMTSPVSIQR